MPDTMDKLEEAGKVIRKRRTGFGYTQADLGELTGLSDRTIRSIESGEGGIALQSWLNVLNVLGLEMKLQIKSISGEAGKSVLQ